ncbi:hypothetical protein BBJ28_00016549 [Nothophytophthora sp. Chile5]|nr:hypothetical protein BBJ28_00016549 [Nothophytophthora sp. Chile5]
MAELLSISALKCYDVLLVAAVMLAADLAMKLWSGRGAQLSPAEQTLLVEYNAQVRLVNRLNSVETFVEQAKATRQMNALKKQLQELAGVSFSGGKCCERSQSGAPFLMGLLMVYYWSEPLVLLPQGYMLPVERFLSLPGFPLGAISAVGWAGVCRRVSSKLLG